MHRPFRPLSLRSQLLALVLAVALPAGAGVAWALSALLDAERAAVDARIQANARQVANNLHLLLREREDQLGVLAARLAQAAPGADACALLAGELARLPAELAALALLDRQGGPRCPGGAAWGDAASPRPPWLDAALRAQHAALGPVMRTGAGGRWTAPLSVPVHDAAGAPAGLLLLPLDLARLQSLVMVGAPEPPALVAVSDDSGAVAMHSVDAARWVGQPPAGGVAERTRGQREGVVSGASLDGTRRLFAFVTVPGTGWRAVAGVPEDQVLARHRALLRDAMLAGGLGAVLLLALARLLGDRIARPILALADTSRRVAGGDVDARAAPGGPTEVAAVALQFNTMLDGHRRDQEALRVSEARHRFLIDHLFAGVVVHAPDGMVTMVNARATELLGLSPAQIGGRAATSPDWRFLREDGQPLPVDDFPVVRVLRNGQPLTDVVTGVVGGAGQPPRWLLVNAYPHRHADGRLREVVVSFVDITALKRAERTLAASEARFRLLVEHSLEGVLQTRPDGTVMAANPAACAMFGLDEATLRGSPAGAVVDMTDPRRLDLRAQRERQGHAAGRLRLKRADGSLFEAEIASAAYRDADGQRVASVVVRDISQRLAEEQARARLEAQLRDAQKLEAIGTLAGGIAHDFNNVLAGLLGHAALAGETLEAGHPAAPHLAQIERAGRRARALVQQILAFGRRQRPLLRRQPLRPLVEETLGLLRATLPAGVQLDAQLADASAEVLCDGNQLQQVLMNLCTNAWHALGPDGAEGGHSGRIGVRLDVVDFAPDDPARPLRLSPGRHVRLQVSDSGCGMDEATRQRIFEPFYTTKPLGRGTGLGLSVVHGIVTAHRGAIVVDSQPGGGSRFSVYLPLDGAADEAPADEVPGAARPDGRGRHVLYIDDDEVMALMVGELLRRSGWRVTTRGGAAEGIAALRGAPDAFDIVVTDFHMPDGTGFDVASAAQQARPGLPVVLSSGYLPEDRQAQAEAAGVRAMLRKERTVDDLPALLDRLLAA